MPDYVKMLLAIIAHFALSDRYPQLATYQLMAQMGTLSQDMAKGLLFSLQGAVDQLADFPCFLHRPPTAEQLYANGPADLEFLTLVESGEGLRYGLKLLDRPRHVIVVGATGAGKTTVIRNIILKIDAHNRQVEDDG